VTALYADIDGHEMALLHVLQALLMTILILQEDKRTIMISNLIHMFFLDFGIPYAPNSHSSYLKLIVGILQ
jgi:cyanate permease